MTEQHPTDNDIGAIPITGDKEAAPAEPRPEQAATPAPQPPKKKKRRARRRPGWLNRLVLAFSGGFALYLLAGYLLLPFLMTTVLANRLAKYLDRPVTIADAGFDPFTLTVTLRNTIVGPRLSDPNDQVDPLLSFSRLIIDLEAKGLVRGVLACRSAEVDQLFLHLVRYKDGATNIGRLMGEMRSGQDREPLRFALNNVVLRDSRLQIDDLPTGKRHMVEDVNLALPSLANFSYAAKQYIAPRFSATINGSPVDLSGETVLAGDTLEASLAVQLKNIDIPRYIAYLPGRLADTVTRGKADIDCKLVFASSPGKDTKLTLEGTGVFSDLWLQDEQNNISRIPKARVAGSLAPLIGRYHFREITLHSPALLLDRTPKGKWSLAGFSLPADTRQGDKKKNDLRIDRLSLSNGTIRLIDRHVPGGFTDTWSEMRMSLKDYALQSGKPAAVALNGKNKNGARLSLQGNLDITQRLVKGFLVIDRLDLSRFNPYIATHNLRIQTGKAKKLEGRFVAGPWTADKANFEVPNASAEIQNLVLTKNGKEWLRLPSLALQKAALDWRAKKLDLGVLQSIKGALFLDRDKEGPPERAARPDQASDKKWRVTLQAVTVKDGALVLRNRTMPEPFDLRLTKLTCAGTSVAGDRRQLLLNGTALVNGSGSLAFDGPLTMTPFTAQLTCRLDKLPVAGLKSLLGNWFSFDIPKGTLAAKGSLNLPAISFQGDMTLDSLEAKSGSKNLFSWQEGRFGKISLTARPFSITIQTVTLDQPALDWSISSSGANFQGIFKAPHNSGADAPEPSLTLPTITLRNGSLALSDLRPKIPYRAAVDEISGTITGFKRAPGNRFHLDLQGKKQKSPVALRGNFGLFDREPFAEFTALAAQVDLPGLAPYTDPLLGYTLTGGTMDIALSYLENKGEIRATNVLKITGLTFGKRLTGDRHLPLTAALLMDPEHTIKLVVPISGAKDAAGFSFQKGFAKTINNLLAKTAIAPFTLLPGNESGAKLPAALIFRHGKGALSPENRRQIARLAETLRQRPFLRLTVQGFADGLCDRKALLEQKEKQAAIQRRKEAAALSKQLTATYGREEIIRPEIVEEPLPEAPQQPKVTAADLKKLAQQRVDAVVRYLVDQEKLAGDRVRPGRLAIASSGQESRCASKVEFVLGQSLWK